MYKSILLGGVNMAERHRDFPSHKHFEDEMYICFGGSATDITEKRTKKVVSGDVFVHEKGVMHRQKDISDFYCAVFQLDISELLRRCDEMGIEDNETFVTLFKNKDKRDGITVDARAVRYAEITSEIIKDEEDPEVRDRMFMNLIAVICSRSHIAREEDSAHEGIEEIVRYMEHNYDKALTLESLAGRSHYSRRHFTRLFREVMGASPMEYLNRVRIKNASDLLVRSDMSIIEIAMLCGFEDNNLFSRRFKAVVKVSPSEYRRLKKSTRV